MGEWNAHNLTHICSNDDTHGLMILSIAGDASPFDFFRQETSNIDVEIRTEAMKKVAIVAALSGPDKSRTEILAYLQSKMLIQCCEKSLS